MLISDNLFLLTSEKSDFNSLVILLRLKSNTATNRFK